MGVHLPPQPGSLPAASGWQMAAAVLGLIANTVTATLGVHIGSDAELDPETGLVFLAGYGMATCAALSGLAFAVFLIRRRGHAWFGTGVGALLPVLVMIAAVTALLTFGHPASSGVTQ